MRAKFALIALLPAALLVLGADRPAADLCPPPVLIPSVDPIDQCEGVFKLVCQPRNNVLSGFAATVADVRGIVTALHGVVGCQRITAFNLSHSYANVRLERVNVRLDAAFLTSPELRTSPSAGLESTDAFAGTGLRVLGYPQGIEGQLSHVVSTQVQPLTRLRELLHAAARRELQRRASPDPEAIVMSLYGPLQHGYSGSPILTDEGRVVAIADGGLGVGGLEISWAIPYWRIDWHDPSDYVSELDRLAGVEPTSLFGVFPATGGPERLYFVDGRAAVGRVYQWEDGRISELYRRPRGRIYSIALAPNGAIYFSDHNDFDLYRLVDGREVRVFTHTTYLRDVEFDDDGRLYFSESSGAGADGYVYLLEDGEASPYYRVRLADVGGYWAGNFAFDPQGDLWLSSGNRVPASLYRVREGRPQRVFTYAGPISGFSFSDDGTLLYSDWRRGIHSLTYPGYLSTTVGSLPSDREAWVSDVVAVGEIEDRLPSPDPGTALYFADAATPAGAIQRLQGDRVTELYRRGNGRIHSVAVATDGSIYFSDHNDRQLYSLEEGHEVLVYTHATYLRDVAFDPRGRLYFSESSGAGGDGIIYLLEDGMAHPHYTVRLSEVDGFWAGDFAFDREGNLWLSSGNRSPAHIYKVDDGRARQVFTSPGAIAGFSFAEDGSLVYADWRRGIHRLSIPEYRDQLVYTGSEDSRLADVSVLARY